MTTLTSILPTGNTSPSSITPSLTLPTPLPAALTAPASSKTTPQTPAQPITLTVVSSNARTTVLSLPNGTQINAKLTPPLPAGSQLQITPAPQAIHSTATTATSYTFASNAIKLMLPNTISNVPATNQTQPITPPPPAPAQNITLPPIATTIAPSTSTTVTQPTTAAPQAPGLSAGPLQFILPASQATHPLAQQLLSSTPPSQPLTATVTSLPNATGQQTISITLPTATQSQTQQASHTAPLQLNLNLGQTIPVGTSLSLQAVPQFSATTNTTTPAANTPITALLLTPTIMAAPSQTSSPTLPTTPPSLPEPHTITVSPSPTPLPATTLIARVLPTPTQPTTQNTASITTPVPSAQTTPVISQPVLLANGSVLTIKTPTPLPAGTTLTLTPTATSTPSSPAFSVGGIYPPSIPSATIPTPLTYSETPATTSSPILPNASLLFPAGTVLESKVTAFSPTGHPIITFQSPTSTATAPQTISMPLTLSSAQNIPLNSQITLQLNADTTATILQIIPPQTTPAQILTTLGQSWNNLQQFQSIAALFFPKMRTFFPLTEALENSNPEKLFSTTTLTVAKALGIDLSSDIQQLSVLSHSSPTTSSATTTENWRTLIFPYQESPQAPLQQGKFFWRQQKQSSDNPENTAQNLRFVVELSLSQLGPVQIDGLHQAPYLWLKLRLQKPLSHTEDNANLIEQINQAIEKTELKGNIVIEVTPTFPVDPTTDILAQQNTQHQTKA